jgi:hypothetical protein
VTGFFVAEIKLKGVPCHCSVSLWKEEKWIKNEGADKNVIRQQKDILVYTNQVWTPSENKTEAAVMHLWRSVKRVAFSDSIRS